MVITDGRDRIIAALEVDHRFNDYEIKMAPDDALQFIEVAPLAGAPSITELSSMIQKINNLIPPIDFGRSDPRTGKSHHSIIVGRHRGKRVLIISLFAGFFKPEYDCETLVEEILAYGQAASARVTINDEGENESIVMRWGEYQ